MIGWTRSKIRSPTSAMLQRTRPNRKQSSHNFCKVKMHKNKYFLWNIYAYTELQCMCSRFNIHHCKLTASFSCCCCGFCKPLKGVRSKHSSRSAISRLQRTLIKPTAFPFTCHLGKNIFEQNYHNDRLLGTNLRTLCNLLKQQRNIPRLL